MYSRNCSYQLENEVSIVWRAIADGYGVVHQIMCETGLDGESVYQVLDDLLAYSCVGTHGGLYVVENPLTNSELVCPCCDQLIRQ